MAQGRSTKIISMIKWIQTSTLSLENSLSVREGAYILVGLIVLVRLVGRHVHGHTFHRPHLHHLIFFNFFSSSLLLTSLE